MTFWSRHSSHSRRLCWFRGLSLVQPVIEIRPPSKTEDRLRPLLGFDPQLACTSLPSTVGPRLNQDPSLPYPRQGRAHCPPFHPQPTVSLSDRTRSFQIAISLCPPQPAAPSFALASESQSSVTLICHTRDLLSIDLSTTVVSVPRPVFPTRSPQPHPTPVKAAHAHLKCTEQPEALKLEA